MVRHLLCKEKVAGSNPVYSTGRWCNRICTLGKIQRGGGANREPDFWGCSSVVERFVRIEEVVGSTPIISTMIHHLTRFKR